MTDNELLELAAKAAGIPGRFQNIWGEIGINNDDPDGGMWNPLEDDAAALRLAVKLRIDVNHGGTIVVAEQVKPHDIGCAEPYGANPAAATRRAIVRAAAAIGASK